MALVGEHGMVEQRGGPTEVARVEGLLRHPDDPVDTADGVDLAGGEFGRLMRPQPGRVAVEPAELALVDGLDVVTDGSVVAPCVPRVGHGWGQLQRLGYLGPAESLIEQPQRLVVQAGVQVTLRG